MNLLNLIESTNVGYDNLRAIQQAADSGQDAVITLGNEPVTIEYPEARFLNGKYKAFLKAGRQEEFLRHLADPVMFDRHMKQLRTLIDKQKNFQGSIPGERDVTEEDGQMSPSSIGRANWERMFNSYEKLQPFAELEFPKSTPLTVYRPQQHGIFAYVHKLKPQEQIKVVETIFADKIELVNFIEMIRKKGFIPAEVPAPTPVSQDPNTPDMFGEAAGQKKNSKKTELDQTSAVNPKVARAFQLARASQPGAGSDVEAYIRGDIEKAEQVAGEIDQVKQDNEEQSKEISQLAQVVKQQNQEIDSLRKEVGKPAEKPKADKEVGKAEPEKEKQPVKAKEKEPKKAEPTKEPEVRPQTQRPQKQQPTTQAPAPEEPPTQISIPEPVATPPAPSLPGNVIPFPGQFNPPPGIELPQTGTGGKKTGTYNEDYLEETTVADLEIGAPVKIVGNVEFKNRTGNVVDFGRDRAFVVVDVQGFGKHSFHSSNIKPLESIYQESGEFSRSGYNEIKTVGDWAEKMRVMRELQKDTKLLSDKEAQDAINQRIGDLLKIGIQRGYMAEGSLSDKAMSVLRGLKGPAQAQTAEPVTPEKQAELDAWAQDFQRNVADKYGKQVVAPKPVVNVSTPITPEPEMDLATVRKKIAQLDELIALKEKIDALFAKAQKVRGGIYPGLQSDIENEELYGVPQTDKDVAVLKDKYTKDLTALQKFLALKKVAWKESREHVSESTSLARLKQARQQLASQTLGEDDNQDQHNARTARILKTLRANYPYAEDDLEALILNQRDDEIHDQAEIDRLDAENDQEEADIARLEKIVKKTIDQHTGLEESLADEFMKMAQDMGMKPRLRGTPDEERARTDAMLKQRAKDRANTPKPKAEPLSAEQRAELEAKLKELEAKFDPDYQYIDAPSGGEWSRQNELAQRINSIKSRLKQDSELNEFQMPNVSQWLGTGQQQQATDDTPGNFSIVVAGRQGKDFQAITLAKALETILPKDYPRSGWPNTPGAMDSPTNRVIQEVLKHGQAVVKDGIGSKDVADSIAVKFKKYGIPAYVEGALEEARAASAGFRRGNKKRAELNAMSPEERAAYDKKRAEQQRKRDDARLEREREKLAAKKKGVAEGIIARTIAKGKDWLERTDGNPNPNNLINQKRKEKFDQLKKKSQQQRQQGVAETVTDVRAGMAKIYNKLAPKIERHRDSFLANQLYDELEAYAELHGAENEFKRIMRGARNSAHMDYDTNPGGFENWFWYLPFSNEQDLEEGSQKFNKPEPYWVCVNGKKWKRFETYAHARAVHDKLEKKLRSEGSDKKVSLLAADDVKEGLRDPKDNPCWKGYKPVGTKQKGGRTVPNCVPKK